VNRFRERKGKGVGGVPFVRAREEGEEKGKERGMFLFDSTLWGRRKSFFSPQRRWKRRGGEGPAEGLLTRLL